jgi:hypothetical protein
MNGYDDMLKSFELDDETYEMADRQAQHAAMAKELARALDQHGKAYSELHKYFSGRNVSVSDTLSLLAMFIASLHLTLWDDPEEVHEYFHESLDVAFDAFKNRVTP